MPTESHHDVLIAGAGLSGIAAAYHLQKSCPDKSFAIVEARDSLGGTWDLFRYPGIRSDSDMHTLGFSFRPWRKKNAIADGASILTYLRETAEHYGIDRKIIFGTRVVALRWSSADARWTIETRDGSSGERRDFSCSFFWACTGYYRYDRGYTPDIPGMDRFGGTIVHPQKWTDDIDYGGKRVIVVGSGATAMTLVPAMADKAQHVTMLQRSPTYVISAPQRDPMGDWLRRHVPGDGAFALIRWRNVIFGLAMYQFCQRFPGRARRFLVGGVRKALGEDFDVDQHFEPHYDPWDQRLCLVPDGDLFAAINSGRVSVVTDHIETITEGGIELKSGAVLEADLIVTATGLSLQFLGGATIEVDGEAIQVADTMMYKGMMLSGVPNAALSLGYSNASWTLKAELTCEYVCNLLKYMDSHGYSRCCPRRDPEVDEERVLGLRSGYVERALHLFPSQGDRQPWKLHQNYLLDRIALRHGRIDDGTLEFR